MTSGVITRTLDTGIHLRVVPASEFGSAAADLVQTMLRRKPNAVIGFPTGSTPLPMYQDLLRRQRQGTLDLTQMRAVMLDDYLGATGDDPVSFHNWLKREFFDPAGVGSDRLLRMPTDPEGIEEACQQYEERLQRLGGVDLQLLGLGLNGHIGFNEPGAAVDSRTHVVPLTATTTVANAAYWDSSRKVPEEGVTMGVGTILGARAIGLLVNGARKADILRSTLLGPIGPDVPASFLRNVADVQVIADQEAAALLP